MKDYYAARAPEYDAVYRKPERQADLRAIERYVGQAFADVSVLEVACGTGYWTQFIAPVAAGVTGIDATPQTLHIARQRIGAEQARFVIGDAFALPVRTGAFGAAFAGFWFSHVPLGRRHEFLSGLHDALTPGAKVLLLDNRFVPGSSTAIADTDPAGNTFQMRRLSDGTAHRILKNFPTELPLRSLGEEFGTEVEYREWQHYWALQYRVRCAPVHADAHFMRLALAQGRHALAFCLPNPPVGCVLVRGGAVVARGFTQAPFQDHAEARALRELDGDGAQVCAYVTLEPCSFHGRTPACAQALIDRGIRRVVVAILDPDPRNQGSGVAILRRAGIEVTVGVLAEQAHADLDPYLALPGNVI